MTIYIFFADKKYPSAGEQDGKRRYVLLAHTARERERELVENNARVFFPGAR